MDHEWTDKRMDDLADRVGRFEANVDQRFDKVDQRFGRVDDRFDRLEAEVKAGFASVAAESKAASAKLNRTIWTGIIVVGISKFLFG